MIFQVPFQQTSLQAPGQLRAMAGMAIALQRQLLPDDGVVQGNQGL